jgi:CHAT domain-containing protein
VATVADPDDAQIVLAPSKSPCGADTVSGRELRGRSYPKLQLVILSSCSTAVPDTSRNGGLFGLARPFLESGAAAVVGTLWSVNDRIAPALLEHFHHGLAAHDTAARSLRLAQLRLFYSGDPRAASPANWAAYCLIETRRD